MRYVGIMLIAPLSIVLGLLLRDMSAGDQPWHAAGVCTVAFALYLVGVAQGRAER